MIDESHGLVYNAVTGNIYHCHNGGHPAGDNVCGDCVHIGATYQNTSGYWFAFHGTMQLRGEFATRYLAMLRVATAAEVEHISNL